MKRNLLITAATLFFEASADIDEVCGYAPLCGSENEVFQWDRTPNSDVFDVDGELIAGAEISFDDCCSLRDTTPNEDCQIVNPSGESERYITSADALCLDDFSLCEDGDCAQYQMVIRPNFIPNDGTDGCCDSCTCYGDPQCISFTGEEKMWMLCDGREIPREDSIFDLCRITERRCSKESDHAGNTCEYLADDPQGRGWVVGKQGSPCVPNPDSPPSVITMYEAPTVNYKLSLQQGERGIITDVYLDLNCGSFVLNARTCLEAGRNAWEYDEDEFDELPEFFVFEDTVHGRDILWSIVDPDSGIAHSIRCHGNYFEDDPDVYVARINVEHLSEPVPNRPNADGFCVTSEFDLGQATTAHTEKINDGDLCDDGLQNSDARDIYRAICQNPGLPQSGQESCIYHFCSRNYQPLYDSVQQCEDEFDESLATGFCRAITYSETEATKCEDQWFESGAIETIQQYYDDEAGCTTESQTSLEKCQSGIVIQYWRSEQWNDEIAFPNNFCGGDENGEVVLSYCDHPRLFRRRIRILQKQANIACGPVNQCVTVDALSGFISLVKDTPAPTSFPTDAPTSGPTPYPTDFPSLYPTEFPTTNNDPTPFPTQRPTTEDNPGDCPQEPLCGTEEETVTFDEDGFYVSMDACCPTNPCPDLSNPDQNRTIGTEIGFCQREEGIDSVTGEPCEDDFEVEIRVTFGNNGNDEECCKTCKCYGDPRCYSFDGDFDEFILCDGRTPGESVDDRCVIRQETCESQRDQEGNQCQWTGPTYSDPWQQEQGENQYSVSRYGSPCRYNPAVSETPYILMYSVAGYEVEVEQGERGYIQSVNLETRSGRFRIEAEQCLDGDDWEVLEAGDEADYQFTQIQYGREYVWKVVDFNTGIELKIRCTGNIVSGDYTNMFINVEELADPNIDRTEDDDSSGFCVAGSLSEKSLATTEYTDMLVAGGYCDNWNEDTSEIMKREVVRIITNNPGVSNTGVENAYRGFCQQYFSPGYGSVSACVNAFEDANRLSELISSFCQAASLQTDECEESIQVLAESDGYKEAFRVAYSSYIENHNEQCNVQPGDLPLELVMSDDVCETGVELQWYNPRKEQWLTYAAFPDNGSACNGYTVTYNYDDDPKLFKNPLRIVQKHNFDHCSTCTTVSSVDAWFTFRE